jgi:hypothetical protein
MIYVKRLFLHQPPLAEPAPALVPLCPFETDGGAGQLNPDEYDAPSQMTFDDVYHSLGRNWVTARRITAD